MIMRDTHKIISSVHLTIASLLASTVSSGPTLAEISKRSSIFENSQDSRYYDKNRDKPESEQPETRNIENVKYSWSEASTEQLADATGSKGHVDYSDRGNYANERKNNRQSIGVGWRDAAPGKPGMDYPDHETIPVTSFTCMDKEPGGYYADVETGCQVFHVCNTGGVKSSFMCPPGSIFNQRHFVCDWWYSFNCDEALDLYDRKIQENLEYSSQESDPIYDKNESSSAVIENFEGTKNFDPHAEKYSEAANKSDYDPTNDISLASSGERTLEFSASQASRRNDQSPTDFQNNVHGYSSNSRAPKSEENRGNIDDVPRGFSRDRDESLREKKIVRNSLDLTNDLASYINYAYFEAGSNNNDNDDHNHNYNDNNNDRNEFEKNSEIETNFGEKLIDRERSKYREGVDPYEIVISGKSREFEG